MSSQNMTDRWFLGKGGHIQKSARPAESLFLKTTIGLVLVSEGHGRRQYSKPGFKCSEQMQSVKPHLHIIYFPPCLLFLTLFSLCFLPTLFALILAPSTLSAGGHSPPLSCFSTRARFSNKPHMGEIEPLCLEAKVWPESRRRARSLCVCFRDV